MEKEREGLKMKGIKELEEYRVIYRGIGKYAVERFCGDKYICREAFWYDTKKEAEIALIRLCKTDGFTLVLNEQNKKDYYDKDNPFIPQDWYDAIREP